MIGDASKNLPIGPICKYFTQLDIIFPVRRNQQQSTHSFGIQLNQWFLFQILYKQSKLPSLFGQISSTDSLIVVWEISKILVVLENIHHFIRGLLQQIVVQAAQGDSLVDKSIDSLLGNFCEVTQKIIVGLIHKVQILLGRNVYDGHKGLLMEGGALGLFLYVYMADYLSVEVTG